MLRKGILLMRRKDREVTDAAKIEKIISQCKYCRLGLNDDGRVYIVPVNLGYKIENGNYIFYFHGAKEGRKIELIRKNGYAGFEMDTNASLMTAETACGHSEYFQSIIGEGKIRMIEDPAEKIEALRLIMEHNTGKSDWDFPDKVVEATGVIRLDVEELSCKANIQKI